MVDVSRPPAASTVVRLPSSLPPRRTSSCCPQPSEPPDHGLRGSSVRCALPVTSSPVQDHVIRSNTSLCFRNTVGATREAADDGLVGCVGRRDRRPHVAASTPSKEASRRARPFVLRAPPSTFQLQLQTSSICFFGLAIPHHPRCTTTFPTVQTSPLESPVILLAALPCRLLFLSTQLALLLKLSPG